MKQKQCLGRNSHKFGSYCSSVLRRGEQEVVAQLIGPVVAADEMASTSSQSLRNQPARLLCWMIRIIIMGVIGRGSGGTGENLRLQLCRWLKWKTEPYGEGNTTPRMVVLPRFFPLPLFPPCLPLPSLLSSLISFAYEAQAYYAMCFSKF